MKAGENGGGVSKAKNIYREMKWRKIGVENQWVSK
jgi:hypothetical protein